MLALGWIQVQVQQWMRSWKLAKSCKVWQNAKKCKIRLKGVKTLSQSVLKLCLVSILHLSQGLPPLLLPASQALLNVLTKARDEVPNWQMYA